MNLKIRQLRLRAHTGQGLYGADIPFKNGLMVVRAENSRGKSTAVQSILFALGLERMITTQPTSALTSAMRDRLIYDPLTKAETSVLSSHVTVEIEGLDGVIATVTRWVVDERVGANLVRVQHAPLDQITSETAADDYYVGRPGGASSDKGFHVWLAHFMGWSMPQLPAREGTSQLYMEQVFPLLFVEQRRGWGGIQAQMPAFSGVTEVRKRAVEFLLALEIGEHELMRQKLRAEESELASAWHVAVAAFVQSLTGSGLKALGLPERLQTAWPDEHRLASVSVSLGDDAWQPLDAYIAATKAELARLDSSQVIEPSDGQPISARIIETLDAARRVRAMDLALREELMRDETELQSIVRRIESLTEDLRQHQDIVILQKLGSTVTDQLADDCPVCHQHLPASLLPTDVPTMTASESVEYIKKQIDLFTSMKTDAEQAAYAKRERWVALRQRGDALNVQAKALRDELTGGISGSFSAEEVAARVALRDRLQQFESIVERFDALQVQLEGLASQAASVKLALKELPKDQLSEQDRKKLRALQRSFVEQLQAYDFGSFSNEMVQIGEDNYLPRRDNFDLQADISASDSVRVIWAYLLGLLEVGEGFRTNHPGLVVFDEPKQQSAKDISFAALLKRAAGGADRQVIFATSEPIETLKSMLNDVQHTLHIVDGYLLQKLA